MVAASPHKSIGAHHGSWDGQAGPLNQVAIPETINEAMQAQTDIQTHRQAGSQTSTDTDSQALEAREEILGVQIQVGRPYACGGGKVSCLTPWSPPLADMYHALMRLCPHTPAADMYQTTATRVPKVGA